MLNISDGNWRRVAAVVGILTAVIFAFAGMVPAQGPPGQEGFSGSFVPGRLLVGFRPDVARAQALDTVAKGGGRVNGEIPQIGVFIVELPEQANEQAYAHAFRGSQGVDFAEPDMILAPDGLVPNDPYYKATQFNLMRIDGPTAWAINSGNSNVIIAILDTGVDGTHEDLMAKMVSGWNAYGNNSDTRDIGSHGTNVAGTAAASGNNGKGVASVCWGCSIMPIRVTDTKGYATYSAIANGLTWASDRGARVANISFIVSNSSTVTSAAKYFRDRGGLVTSSAGNYSTFDSSADNPHILTISATTNEDVLTSYSNTGKNIDLAAPGSTWSTWSSSAGGGYGSVGGTSHAAPMVAGVAALVFSVNPGLSPSQVENILKQSADDLGTPDWDTSYGWGRVNAGRAVSMAHGGGTTTDTVAPSIRITWPTVETTVSGKVTVRVDASDNVGIASVGLSVGGGPEANDSTAPYEFLWNTADFGNGQHSLKAIARDAAGNSASDTQYVTVNNVPDTAPPSIVILAPKSGATVKGNVTVTHDVADNTGVVRVELYVNGALTDSTQAAPFNLKWNTAKAAKGSHVLHSKAFDGAGNSATSPPVTVKK